MHFYVFVRACVCMYACIYVCMYVCTSVRIHIRWRDCVSLSSHLQASDSVYLCVSQPSQNENDNENVHQEKAEVCNKKSTSRKFKKKIIKAEHKKVMILYDKNKQKKKLPPLDPVSSFLGTPFNFS